MASIGLWSIGWKKWMIPLAKEGAGRVVYLLRLRIQGGLDGGYNPNP